MDDNYYDPEIVPMENPNLYVTMTSSGYLWSSATYPWTEITPWTFNAGI